jgi:hypothetical protein
LLCIVPFCCGTVSMPFCIILSANTPPNLQQWKNLIRHLLCKNNSSIQFIYLRAWQQPDMANYNNNNNNNPIQFFILTCWLNSYKSQLQSQHKKMKQQQHRSARLLFFRVEKRQNPPTRSIFMVWILYFCLFLAAIAADS